MKEFTRREVLGSLLAQIGLAAPALSLLPAFGRTEPSGGLARAGEGRVRIGSAGLVQEPQGSGAPFQRVNVLFHGLTVLEFATDEVHVYLPMAASARAYLAGTWMQEESLQHETHYRLSGVMTGSRPDLSALDPQRNAVFAKRGVDASLAFCTLSLPFPDFVTPLRPLAKKHGKNFFLGAPAPVAEPLTLPQVVAFTYLHPDPTSPLELHRSGWTPVIEEGVVNLHVWDAPVKTPNPQISLEAFAQMAKLIGATRLQLNPVYDTIRLPRPANQLVLDGVSCQEEWTLVERMSENGGCRKHAKYRPVDDAGLNCLSIFLY